MGDDGHPIMIAVIRLITNPDLLTRRAIIFNSKFVGRGCRSSPHLAESSPILPLSNESKRQICNKIREDAFVPSTGWVTGEAMKRASTVR